MYKVFIYKWYCLGKSQEKGADKPQENLLCFSLLIFIIVVTPYFLHIINVVKEL